MKNIQIRKTICTIMLIMKDGINLLAGCLIATILVCVCMENGWVLSDYITDVSHDMFWKMYSAISILVPIIMFYRGAMGRYKVEIKEYKAESALGYAKLGFNGGTSMDFLTNLESETLKAELLAFLELRDDEFDISSMGEFEEQFVEFIKDDLSYAD